MVYERLSQINFSAISSPEASSEHPALQLSEHEQHLATIVLAAPPHGELQGLSTVDHLDLRRVREQHGPVLDQLTALGVLCEVLADGSLIATLAQPGSATDQVAQTARCALLVFERWPSSYVGVATGRGTLDGRTVIGEAIDRAVRLVRAQLLKLLGTSAESLLAPSREGIWLDEVSAGLLDRRFERAARGLHVGALSWNAPTVGASSRLPFGGVKNSGNHRPAGSFSTLYCAYPMAVTKG